MATTKALRILKTVTVRCYSDHQDSSELLSKINDLRVENALPTRGANKINGLLNMSHDLGTKPSSRNLPFSAWDCSAQSVRALMRTVDLPVTAKGQT